MKQVAIYLALCSAAFAQDLTHKAPKHKGRTAIIDAKLMGGAQGYVLFENGRIVASGTGELKLDGDVKVIDAKGKHLYPGFIASYTHLGLTEIGAVRATLDMSEVGELKPEVRAAVAVNPDSTLLPVTRSNGVLTFATFPRGGAIPGRASVMSMDGWTWEEMAIRADAGLVISWPNPDPPPPPADRGGRRRRRPEERGSKRLKRIEEAFAAARAYLGARKWDPKTPVDIRWEAMRPALEGKRPVFFLANDYAQIVSALDFATREKLNAILVGGRDAPLCADQIKKQDVPVILRSIHTFPRRNDSDINEMYTLPAKLEAAGIRWCLASGERTANERNLPYSAGRAVAYGLSREAALRSITSRAAEILGVGDQLGTLDKAKRATFFLSDGDPLEVPTKVVDAWIDGKRIDLSNKQTKLAEKYREKLKQRE
ncbi:MAG: amidohydrolase family protein [Planctomycetota bacterium]|jgi:imidazolonepropionase-like amidohydrolase